MDPRESGKRISHGPLVRVGLARRASRKNRPSSASRQLPVNRCFIPLINCGDKNYIALSSPRGNGLMHPSILFPSSNIPNIYVYIFLFSSFPVAIACFQRNHKQFDPTGYYVSWIFYRSKYNFIISLRKTRHFLIDWSNIYS